MTDISLKDYLEAQINALDRRVDERFIAVASATDLIKAATEIRLHALNEARATLNDQSAKFITREAVQLMFDQIAARLTENTKRLDRIEGKGIGLNAAWGYFVGAVGILWGLYEVLKSGIAGGALARCPA